MGKFRKLLKQLTSCSSCSPDFKSEIVLPIDQAHPKDMSKHDHEEYRVIMANKFSLLPLEVTLIVLSYLPFESLLSFGETSRANYQSHILCLRHLRLGVFEKRIHSLISYLQAGWATPEEVSRLADPEDTGSDYTISIIEPRTKQRRQGPHENLPPKEKCSRRRMQTQHEKSRTQDQMILLQNRIFSKIVNRYGPSLVKLEFMAYDIDAQAATVLGTKCQNTLRHLALRFEHPHIRDGHMRPSTWLHPAPGSTVWNFLIGIGRHKHMGVSGLESLIMERTGITPWQLMMLVKKNPQLKVLKLRTCRGVHPDFLNWLGGIESDPEDPQTDREGSSPGDKLEVLWLENCHRVMTQSVEDPEALLDENCDRGLEWVRGLRSLKSLSFSECMNIQAEHVDRANKTIWNIKDVILPYALNTEDAIIEVDPSLL